MGSTAASGESILEGEGRGAGNASATLGSACEEVQHTSRYDMDLSG